MEALFGPSIDLIRALQRMLPDLTAAMKALSWLGEEGFYILLIGIVYFFRSPGTAVRLLVVLILSNYTNALLKWSFHGPRPLWLDSALLAPAIELSYGAPSGHAQNAVAVWGCLALSFQKRRGALFAGALVLAFLISFSRLYLAVHFPHDILFGWVAGAAVLYVVTAFESDVTTRMAEMHPTRRALAILFAAALLGVVAWGASSLITSIPDPEIWAANAVTRGAAYMPDPKRADTLSTTIGLFWGLGLLAVFGRRFKVESQPGFQLWKNAMAFVLITGGVLIVRMLLSVKGLDSGPAAQVLRVVRYAVVGAWAFSIGPILLSRMGLLKDTSP